MDLWHIELRGSAGKTNTNFIQKFQIKILEHILKAPRYISNWFIRQNSDINTVIEEVIRFATKYKDKLENHPNQLAKDLLSSNTVRRLSRFIITIDLTDQKFKFKMCIIEYVFTESLQLYQKSKKFTSLRKKIDFKQKNYIDIVDC